MVELLHRNAPRPGKFKIDYYAARTQHPVNFFERGKQVRKVTSPEADGYPIERIIWKLQCLDIAFLDFNFKMPPGRFFPKELEHRLGKIDCGNAGIRQLPKCFEREIAGSAGNIENTRLPLLCKRRGLGGG